MKPLLNLKWVVTFGNLSNLVATVSKALSGLDKQQVSIRIVLVKGKRSDDQNSRHWARMAVLAQRRGQDADWWHEAFKERFLKTVIIDKDGCVVRELVGSSAALDTQGFSDWEKAIDGLLLDEYGEILPDVEFVD